MNNNDASEQIVSVEICSTEIFDDFVSLELFDNAATCRKIVLNGFQIEFVVSATTASNEKYTFNVALQSEDRTNGMRSYSKCGMCFAGLYGYDSDEHDELHEFLTENHSEEFAEEFIDLLIDTAEEHARDYVRGISDLDQIIMLIRSENEYLSNRYDRDGIFCIADKREFDKDKITGSMACDFYYEPLELILNEFDLEDDDGSLLEAFGAAGLRAIRKAEKGTF